MRPKASIVSGPESSAMSRWGNQIEGGAKAYNPKKKGRASHHPLLAFVAD